jgi:hypothetical protein
MTLWVTKHFSRQMPPLPKSYICLRLLNTDSALTSVLIQSLPSGRWQRMPPFNLALSDRRPKSASILDNVAPDFRRLERQMTFPRRFHWFRRRSAVHLNGENWWFPA